LEYQLDPLDTTTSHTFILSEHYDRKITPQKILKKFPLDVKQNLGQKVKTIPGSVGMLIDGVEIENNKSTDSIFYGSISNFSVITNGSDYDVVNPPVIDIDSIESPVPTKALVSPVIKGDIKEFIVDPQEYDIENVASIKISGGNGGGDLLQPIISYRNRVLEFNGVTTSFGGGVDTYSETITFSTPHNLTSGQALIYDRNKNQQLGIGTFKGSNISASEFLIDGLQYWPEVVGLSTIRLYRSEDDYISGINTIGFTESFKDGIHKFRIKDSKKTLSGVRILETGKPYYCRKVYVNPTGISTEKSIVTFNNHGFSEGELISYQASVGLGSTTPESISGLTTLSQYKIIKIDDDSFRLSNAGVGGTDNTD